MKQKIWFILVLLIIVAAIGGVLTFKRVTALYFENMDRPRAVRIWISPSDQFSIFYFHSVYNEPASEEFQVDRGTIVLKGVRTKSPGILEFYGFDDMKSFHPMNQRWGAVFFKVEAGEGQGLIIRDKKIYFSELGEKGDRIQLRAMFVPLGYYLLSVVYENLQRIVT